MPDRNESGRDHRTIRSSKRRRLIFAGIGFLVIIICLLWAAGLSWDRRSADERLAEIEAARAIPDAENAAMLYGGLLQDPNVTSLLSNGPQSLEPPIFYDVSEEPWRTEDHPELAAWITEHRYVIDSLLDATRLEKCRFPITTDITDTSYIERAAPMRQWAFLLTIAANNDLAEGRLDAAMTKWGCILRMGQHLQQQLDWTDHSLAASIQRLALRRVARFIMLSSPTEAHLRQIESMPLPTEDVVGKCIEETRTIERLAMQKVKEGWGLLDHLQGWWFQRRINKAVYGTIQGPDSAERAGHQYACSMATARGTRILVAMKRYKSTTGRWPASLGELEASLPDEVLTDPLNKGPFVYKPAGDAFVLYSRGRNDIDENGEWDADAWESGVQDDWPIWPLPAPKPQPKPSDERIRKELEAIYGSDYVETCT